MTPCVVMEVHAVSHWSVVPPRLTEADAPGSFSADEERGRQVYMFGWIAGVAGVWRALGGVDVETPTVRIVSTSGLEELSDLTEPYEMTRATERGLVRLRFRRRGGFGRCLLCGGRRRADGGCEGGC